jgi:hypothetical protein
VPTGGKRADLRTALDAAGDPAAVLIRAAVLCTIVTG